MIIKAGKSYEGQSDNFRLADGTYEFQITKVDNTKGRVSMVLTTSTGKNVYKTFFLRDKDGKESDKNMAELADFVTTAMQIEDEEVEVDVKSCLGFYLICTIKNSSYETSDELGNPVTKKTYYVRRPERCNGFSDGRPPIIKEAVREEEEEGEEVELPFDAPNTGVSPDDDDAFAKYMGG